VGLAAVIGCKVFTFATTGKSGAPGTQPWNATVQDQDQLDKCCIPGQDAPMCTKVSQVELWRDFILMLNYTGLDHATGRYVSSTREPAIEAYADGRPRPHRPCMQVAQGRGESVTSPESLGQSLEHRRCPCTFPNVHEHLENPR
jgi:hypothetical protein